MTEPIESYWLEKFNSAAYQNTGAQRVLFSEEGYLERHRVIAQLLKVHAQDRATLLDVGCGVGMYFDIYESLGFSYSGIDMSPNQIQAAQELFPKANLICGNILRDADIGHYDVIVSIGVVSCVSDIDVFFDAIHRRLNPNGIAVIEFLNKESIKPKSHEDQHLLFYREQDVDPKLKRGFSILEKRRVYVFPGLFRFFKYVISPFQVPYLNHSFIWVLQKR